MVKPDAEVQALRERLLEADRRLSTLPGPGSDREPPRDPTTGEVWDRFNILGHMGEFGTFWSRELAAALAGAPQFGRAPGSTARQDAVSGGASAGAGTLQERIVAGVQEMLALLDRLHDDDLDRTVDMRGRGEVTVRWVMDSLLVGHFEAHTDQLFELTQPV